MLNFAAFSCAAFPLLCMLPAVLSCTHPPAGSYQCLQGIKSFIQWQHPCVRVMEAKPATITLPPCVKDPIRLQSRQDEPTLKQKLRQERKHKVKEEQHDRQQAWLDETTNKLCSKYGKDGPDSPWITVSYEDKYTKVGPGGRFGAAAGSFCANRLCVRHGCVGQVYCMR